VSGSIRAREQRAEKAVAGLSRGNRFEDWIDIGEGLLAGRERAMQRAGATKPYGQKYKAELADWRDRNPWTQDRRLKHPAGVNAIWVVENIAAIEAWRATLPDDERDAYNHPSTIRKEFTRAQQPAGARPRRTRSAPGTPSGNRKRIADLEAQLKAARDLADALRVAFDQVQQENLVLRQEIEALKARASELNGYAKYPLLGLDPPFSIRTVNRHYRQASKGYHPDGGGFVDQMQRLNDERGAALKEASDPASTSVSSP
jgi:hypothetical protein